jgi:hypothetical protein
MPLTSKILWAVSMDTPAEQNSLAQTAHMINANVVCIRTNSPLLQGSIAAFHALNIQVYGWRWPAIVPTHSPPHYSTQDQADFVATVLIPAGLDGYIVDPESDDDRGVNDWERTDVDTATLAQDFCATIKNAVARAGRPFVFGTTSGSTYPVSKPRIPFAKFFAASDKVYPQTYWRARDRHDNPVDIHGGTPASSMSAGLAAFAAAGKPIIPMAGEIDCAKPAEIAAYGALLVQHGINEGHFYDFNHRVPPEVLSAIQAL